MRLKRRVQPAHRPGRRGVAAGGHHRGRGKAPARQAGGAGLRVRRVEARRRLSEAVGAVKRRARPARDPSRRVSRAGEFQPRTGSRPAWCFGKGPTVFEQGLTFKSSRSLPHADGFRHGPGQPVVADNSPMCTARSSSTAANLAARTPGKLQVSRLVRDEGLHGPRRERLSQLPRGRRDRDSARLHVRREHPVPRGMSCAEKLDTRGRQQVSKQQWIYARRRSCTITSTWKASTPDHRMRSCALLNTVSRPVGNTEPDQLHGRLLILFYAATPTPGTNLRSAQGELSDPAPVRR